METLPKIVAGLVGRGARPVTITMRTTPRLRKAIAARFGNPYKVSVVNGILNFKYEKSVNRQLEREEKTPDFRTQAAWFEHTEIPGIVRSKSDHSKLYLQLKVEKAIESSFFKADGTPIPKQSIAKHLPKHSKPTHQGVEKFVRVIEVAFSSVQAFVCDGRSYKLGETWGEFFKIDLAKRRKKNKIVIAPIIPVL